MAAMEIAAAVAELVAKHCTDVVMSPGSRNSPLAYALLARQDVRVHMRIDERSAAFTALGLARVQRRHVGVVMTSGTAVANAYPAVIEAHMSHTPIAVISADRPERLVGTGASQTIWQQGIFGRYAETQQVATLDDVHAVRFTDTQVHINVALDTPLVPAALPEPVGAPRRVGPGSLASSAAGGIGGANDHGEVDVDLTRDTLVIAGDEAWEVPGLEHVPTIAEPTAPTPFHQVHPLAARFFAQSEVAISHDGGDFAATTKPEQVIVVGHPTLHRDVMALLADPDIEVIGISRTGTFTGQPDRRGSRVNVTGQPTDTWLKICEAAGDVGAGRLAQPRLELLRRLRTDVVGADEQPHALPRRVLVLAPRQLLVGGRVHRVVQHDLCLSAARAQQGVDRLLLALVLEVVHVHAG